MNSENAEEARVVTNALLRRYHLCDSCLGRQFPGYRPEVENKERGKLLRKTVSVIPRTTSSKAAASKCYLCEGLTSSTNKIADRALKVMERYEYQSFLVGASLPPRFAEREDRVRSQFKLRGGETIKGEITRLVGKAISEKTGKKVRFRCPNLTILIDPLLQKVDVHSRSLYLFGRYTKNRRGLPQRRTRCRSCRGRGCGECDYTGVSGVKSVEALLSNKILTYFKGNRVRFTWIGSEDAESLVLGRGRPFYAEVCEPKIRSLDASRLASRQKDEDVAITEIRIAEGKPEGHVDFIVTVSVQVEFADRVEMDSLRRLSKSFTNMVVEVKPADKQKTLSRRVYGLRTKRVSDNRANLTVRCDGGVSVKGLVGEQGFGRAFVSVTPNVSEVLKVPCRCIFFDILDVEVGREEVM